MSSQVWLCPGIHFLVHSLPYLIAHLTSQQHCPSSFLPQINFSFSLRYLIARLTSQQHCPSPFLPQIKFSFSLRYLKCSQFTFQQHCPSSFLPQNKFSFSLRYLIAHTLHPSSTAHRRSCHKINSLHYATSNAHNLHSSNTAHRRSCHKINSLFHYATSMLTPYIPVALPIVVFATEKNSTNMLLTRDPLLLSLVHSTSLEFCPCQFTLLFTDTSLAPSSSCGAQHFLLESSMPNLWITFAFHRHATGALLLLRCTALPLIVVQANSLDHICSS